MKFRAALYAITMVLAAGAAPATNDFRQLTAVNALPTALDRNFEFRKTKLFFLGDTPGPLRGASLTRGMVRDPSIGFENAYRLFGAVTALDQRRRFGHYLDFFWRARRPGTVTVRLEYRQEKLRSFTQAREVTYPNARGSYKTEFAIIGDDFFNEGRLLAWRALLIEKGRIVAEERSFLWR